MRTFDPTFLNSVANNPEVRLWLGGQGPIDLTATLDNPGNYAFCDDTGGFVVIQLHGARYECHTIFSPDRRGVKGVLDLMFAAQQYMFTQTPCDDIVTKVPDENRGADWLARAGKFVEGFRRNGVSYRSLSLDRWAQVCSTAPDEGRAFHLILEAAKQAAGSALAVHGEDELHDRMVGAAILMAKTGNVVKGVNFYNSWALWAGYAPISLLSEQPAVIDIIDAVIGLDGSNLRVMKCR